jgi:hypothetical protein
MIDQILADPLKGTLVVVFAAVAIAWTIGAVRAFRAKRRSAWNRRFVDTRFSPRQEEVRKHYAEFERPTYLRTCAEEERLMPRILRRQAE